MKLVITGQNGFIGSHLYNTIKFQNTDIEILDFKNNYFENESKIDQIIAKADIIVHLAGVNRSDDQDFLYNQNIILTDKLIESITRVSFKGKLIFASSIQEELGNAYGRAKKQSRESFHQESKKLGFAFIGLIIPNVFGSFCKPHYNSFISTFCSNSILGQENKIIEDQKVQLIYIDNLIKEIMNSINYESTAKKIIDEDIIASVSEVKKIIENYNHIYYKMGEIPSFNSEFKINLFNTFNSFINIENYFPRKYNVVDDSRGSFAEIIRANNLGQYSYSKTLSGETRGNHFHTRKIERFAVISGNALIELRKIGTSKKYSFEIDGDSPSYIDMPIWHTHNIKNVGKTPLITLFWINEFYNQHDSDTFFEKV